MTYQLIQEESLQNIGDAIRSKTGTTEKLSPAQMAAAILSISTGGGSVSSEATFITAQVHVDSTKNAGWVTLLSGDSFVASHYNDTNLCVILTPDNLDEVDSNTYSSMYQWTTMFASNKAVSIGDELWYGMGVYMMLGKGYSYPSTLNIPYGLNNDSQTNYSYFNTNENGDVRLFLHNYDVLASGDYTLNVGLLS